MLAACPSQPTLMSTHVRSANNAGNPLPSIPRRISSTASPIQVTLQAPSPPPRTLRPSSSSSSSLSSDSDSEPGVLPKTSHCSKPSRPTNGSTLGSIDQSTPTPSVPSGRSNLSAHLGKFSTMLSAQVDTDIPSRSSHPPRRASVSSYHPHPPMPTHSRSQTISVPASMDPKFLRKKSGEPLKSSLKSSRSTPRASLSILTFSSSPLIKSEPATPSAKSVHFDSQLEHVKLFLAEQKPIAVSRDGSPTDDTSGTDSDFPSFIFDKYNRDKHIRDTPSQTPSHTPSQDKPTLALTARNMPKAIKQDVDVVLEDITISDGSDSIIGHVRVRNIAFQKWVTIRFTLDAWQTTSEVSARYESSVSSAFDRFGFVIRLDGLLSRIEGREMLLAVRFNIDGREMWDNNDGVNYHLAFSLAKPSKDQPDQHPVAAVKEQSRSKVSSGRDGSAGSGSDVGEDLKTKLQEVVIQRWDSKVRAEQQAETTPSFRSTNSLAPRYDFASSLKNKSWTANSVPWPADGHTSPTPLPRRIAQPLPPLGSPRDHDKDTFRPAYVPPESTSASPRSRNHHRGGGMGYFDSAFSPTSSGGSSSLRSSPNETPRIRSLDDMAPPLSSPKLLHSLDYSPPSGLPTPPSVNMAESLKRLVLPRRAQIVSLSMPGKLEDDEVLGEEMGLLEVPSAESTPSMVSPASSTTSSPSDSPSFDDFKTTLPIVLGEAEDKSQDYRQLLTRFCFYTGTPSSEVTPAIELVRTQSASSVEEFLLSTSPRLRSSTSFSPPRLPRTITPCSSTDTLRCVLPV